ncbi:uclacyanin-3-like [Papaver somniferum]|uniref:uclacyanin-3-like n=1 Tax=Papaver somniferum TaxID=3469 RepID=UPI000E7035EC|nr:uclacyanin-3-like [Papaver somniferum]
MLTLRTLMSLAVTAMFIKSAIGATTHKVGGPDGTWDQITDLTKWAKGVTFKVGDTLDFTYGAQHNVFEVKDKKAYDACDTSDAISSDDSGETPITLSSVGKRFFVCGASDHCAQGMKVTIDTVSSTTPSTPALSPPKPTPSADSPPVSQGTTSEPPPATKPTAPNAGNGGYEVNFAMVLGFGFMTLLCL